MICGICNETLNKLNKSIDVCNYCKSVYTGGDYYLGYFISYKEDKDFYELEHIEFFGGEVCFFKHQKNQSWEIYNRFEVGAIYIHWSNVEKHYYLKKYYENLEFV